MADNTIVDDARDAVEDQIAQLRTQLESITRSLGDHGIDIDEMREEAKNLADGAIDTARRAASFAENEAKAVAKVARKNPAGATTALGLAAAIGFGVGYLVCQLNMENTHHRNWW